MLFNSHQSDISPDSYRDRDQTSDLSLLFYSPRFYPLLGGLERVVEAWATALTKQGVSVSVVTNTSSDTADDFFFPVYRQLPFLKLVKLMRRADAVVQFNVSLKGLPAWWLSRKPLCISHHTLLVEADGSGAWQQRLKLLVSNWLTGTNICCSHYIAAQFRQAQVIHSPYHAHLFTKKQQPRRAGSLVFAGRLVTDKGVDLLLKALASIDPTLYASLTIAGEGPEKAALEALAANLHIKDKVVFSGKVTAPALAALLNQSEIMIVPSVVEPFGITVLEGLACGCRMVVSDAGGLPEAAGGFAGLFESGHVAALAEAIKKALSQPIAVHEAALAAHLEKLTVAYTSRQFYEAMERVLLPASPPMQSVRTP